jgi:sulfur-carrier protein
VPTVVFTSALKRFLAAPPASVPGATVRAALDAVFRENPALRGYLLDDQGRLRTHVHVFVDGELIKDRVGLSDGVRPAAELYVMQALSGG